MPHSPPGGGCNTPPMSPWPCPIMSMNALRSIASAMALRSSKLLNGGASRLTNKCALMPPPGVNLAVGLGDLALHVLELRDAQGKRKRHIDISRNERQH